MVAWAAPQKMKRLPTVLIVAALLACLPASLDAQANFVYTNDDPFFATNTVSAFSVAADGVLAPVSGSPFPTLGTGAGGRGLFASNRVGVCPVGNFLYAGNSGSDNVSGFSINSVTGALTLVSGSPFATGGSARDGISLAASPNGQFLFAGNPGSGNITVFSIAANGALTPITGSPFPAGGTPDGMKVSPDGRFLSVALFDSPGRVGMFSIAAGGALSQVIGSPFPDGGTGIASGVDIRCASDRLFAGEAAASTTVDVFDIAANGSLTPIAGSPFTPGVGVNSNVPLLSPDDQLLFVSNQDSSSVTVFEVASSGSLTLVAGSPFPVGGGALLTSGMATNQAGTLLYVANFPNLVGVFSIDGSGVLTPAPGSPFSTGQSTGLLSIAAFPPKACVLDDEVDLKIDLTPGSNLNCIKTSTRGIVAVAIFGSSTFDVADINPLTIQFGGASPAHCHVAHALMEGPASFLTTDGIRELICQFRPANVTWPDVGSDCETVTLTGQLNDGTPIQGSDQACLTGEATCEASPPGRRRFPPAPH